MNAKFQFLGTRQGFKTGPLDICPLTAALLVLQILQIIWHISDQAVTTERLTVML